ncbi:MAG: YeeE/YedE family protein, partial [Anaerolineae bacterium]|nr:YeeE/YedE family protein [Anaerolineae bacterium]
MFDTSFFADPTTLLLGALTGLIFGFLLRKGGLTRFNVIVGQFLLEDFTVLKVMLTAIVIGSTGIYGMFQLGLIDGLHVKAAHLVANALGGLIFGAGMAILGYCPGTGVAALGNGSRDAIAGVAGMLFGAALYAEVYPWAKKHIVGLAD